MTRTLPIEERALLRALAKRQAETAALPVMRGREKLWTDTNDCVPGARPPFAIESWTLYRDFMPDTLLQCASETGRRLERALLRNIRHHEVFNDDHVCPDSFDIPWRVWCDEFGVDIKVERAMDAEGFATGYHFDPPIKDLSGGFGGVRPARFGVDRDGTMAEKAFLEELFGDILPVRVRGDAFGNGSLTQRAVWLMSMEKFFMAMHDCPDALHALMGMLRDNVKRMSLWAEAEGLLTPNNGNQCTCGTCLNFTTKLPRQPFDGRTRLSDMWLRLDSQETVGVSPAMFHEFCFPYYAGLAAMFGFVYWGCCEPADPIWEMSLSKLPNLRAVSISRWANQAFMAEALAGRDIVYSFKPDPNLLSLHHGLDEPAWRAHIRATLEAATRHNLPLEFVVRDVYTLKGNLAKARRAVELANAEIDRFYGPRSW